MPNSAHTRRDHRLPRLRRVISAGTINPNTPETDLLPTVPHRVTGTSLDGTEPFAVRVEAAEPGEALDLVATMPQEQFDQLPRIAAKD